MSTPFYDLASLVVVPSGYKASKVYAQKPLTTDGQLTFSRASTATRVNASGLIETVSSNVPRLDYLGSTCPKLLLEPQRTNIALYSEQFDNAAWPKINTTVTANVIASPDGYTNADKIIPANGNNIAVIYQTIISPGTSTVSIYAKAGEFGGIVVATGTTGAFFNLTTGQYRTAYNAAPTAYSITSVGNAWYRCSVTLTSAVTDNLYIGANDNVSNDLTVTGNGTNGIYIYGAMLEAGAYPTSYVKTEAAAVTRLADACSKTGISSLIGQTEGVIFLDFVYNGIQNLYGNLINSEKNVTNSFYIHLGLDGNIRAGVFANSVQRELTASGFVIGQRYKLAFAYKTGESAIYSNGVQKVTSASSFTFNSSLDDIVLNDPTTYFGYQENVSFNQALLFKTRLTNAQLAELTSL